MFVLTTCIQDFSGYCANENVSGYGSEESEYLDLYVDFLQVTAKDLNIPMHHKMILDEIGLCCFNEVEITVKDIIAKRHLGSPAVIHRRLAKLRRAGYVIVHQKNDLRIKYLTLGERAISFYSSLGARMFELS